MNEKDSIKDLESQARNTKHLMDKLNRAAYGMTFDEAIRIGKIPQILDTNKEET
jgi:hypothetical protein|nr:MAG TPA: hypothetical protein [Caudoviricetes sp.]